MSGVMPIFATTHWSVVLEAGNGNSPQASDALEKLCRAYWYPLYAYIRRDGHNAADSQDLTQEFFASLLSRNSLAQVDPRKGKFRSFLLAALRHFLSDQRDRARALKRGGATEFVFLDAEEAEKRYRIEPVDRMDAERVFQRRWALTLIDRSLTCLRTEAAAAGKAEAFEHLKDFVAGESDSSCAEVAKRVGWTESAVKSLLHRLRQRYRQLVRNEIAQTVVDPAEIQEEIRFLIEIMSQ